MRIKCPICKGESNRQWFSHLDTSKPDETYAVFVVECWAGELRKLSKYHYFIAKIKIPVEIEIDQNQIQEEEKEE